MVAKLLPFCGSVTGHDSTIVAYLAYFLLSFLISIVFLPTPSISSCACLIRRAFFSDVPLTNRLQIIRHVASIASFFPVILALAPIDFVIALLYSVFRRPAPPIFICGTPRSGSTMLHRLLIESSSELYGVTHFEWRYPSLLFQLICQFTGLKRLFSDRNYWATSSIGSTLSQMHPNTLGDYEEDAILFEERVGCHPYQFLHLPYSSLNSYYSRFNQPLSGNFFSVRSKLNRLYRFTNILLSPLKFPARRFVSKEVATNERLDFLYENYPGSRFIIITRNPVNYLSSLRPLLEMSTISKTSSHKHLSDPNWWPSWYEWLVWQANLVMCFFRSRSLIVQPRVIHVSYEALTKSPRAELHRIFLFLGLPEDALFKRVLDEFEAAQMTRRRGYEYTPVVVTQSDFAEFINEFYC